MASALLAARDEPSWGERKVYMRKAAIPNPNPNPNPNHNPRSIPFNPSPITHPNHGDHATDRPQSPAGAGAAASDDSSSLNRKIVPRRDTGAYVSYNISAYSSRELKELKRRLVSELEQVRSLLNRIESSTSGAYSGVGLVNPVNMKPQPAASPRNPKRMAVAASESEKLLSTMMKKCGQILTKLMKHKKSVWFNSPVDVVGMGLHDYHQIIKHPMDLGTVKSRLNKGFYSSPMEYAADIRLTFNNALLYNPQGHEVHKLADQFLRLFEGLFSPAYDRYEKQCIAITQEEEERQRASSWSHAPPMLDSVAVNSVPPPSPIPVPPPLQPPVPALVPPPTLVQSKPQEYPLTARTAFGKHPKPKAKDPIKRPMTLEEKQKLSFGLQSLPEEKMAQVLQIVRKRNLDPTQHGDEIELDIEAMDTETLWELDRFLCNCKKTLSKIKRREVMASSTTTHANAATTSPILLMPEAGHRSPLADDLPDSEAVKKSKKADTGDEDIDIGDEMPPTSYPPVEIEKDAGYSGSSSSSGSDSSSSSDSDSGSSSGSDSDEGDAQSPGVGLRSSPRN
ncbi:transcription factor GTE7-like [Typha latifolia]|uniref:transcription factor GTE7-like n=1 Tax=Typha latifolia TaxID=4733 RepID=UPI003C2E38A6